MIWLIGMMGAGKTTVGRILADRLGGTFVDLDRQIEIRAGRPVDAIFRESGEPAFRALEAGALRAAARSRAAVVATGGGAVLDPKNVSRMRASGTVVWLDSSAATLARRVGAGEGRPLLAKRAAGEGVGARLRRIARERAPLYARAALHRISSDRATPAEIARDVLRLVGAFPAPIEVSLPGSAARYAVHVESGALDRAGEVVRGIAPGAARAVVVTDANVARLHAARLERGLRKAGFAVTRIVMPAGERNKNARTVVRVWDSLLSAGVDRRTPVIALGGGVVGDVAGFAAATTLRGLPLVQIPTTLVAQVDSAIGGKTGFDTEHGKNLVGAFKHPALVLSDVDLLATLPARELRAGFAEVVKYGVIVDGAFFSRLEAAAGRLADGDAAELEHVVRRCAAIKARVVSRDPDEKGLRAILNFGHTVGHGLEAASGYRMLHGEAVSAGMVAEAELAVERGDCRAADAERVTGLLFRLGLPVAGDGRAASKFLRVDKKRSGRHVRLPMMRRVGKVDLRDVLLADVVRFVSGWYDRERAVSPLRR